VDRDTKGLTDPETCVVEQYDQKRIAYEPAGLDQTQHFTRRQLFFVIVLLDPAWIAQEVTVLAPRRTPLADMFEERLVDPVHVTGFRDLGRIDREIIVAVIEALKRFDRDLNLVAGRCCENPCLLLRSRINRGLGSAFIRRASRHARQLSFSANKASWMPVSLVQRKFAKSTTWLTQAWCCSRWTIQ
jgi:hypothetical protein